MRGGVAPSSTRPLPTSRPPFRSTLQKGQPAGRGGEAASSAAGAAARQRRQRSCLAWNGGQGTVQALQRLQKRIQLLHVDSRERRGSQRRSRLNGRRQRADCGGSGNAAGSEKQACVAPGSRCSAAGTRQQQRCTSQAQAGPPQSAAATGAQRQLAHSAGRALRRRPRPPARRSGNPSCRERFPQSTAGGKRIGRACCGDGWCGGMQGSERAGAAPPLHAPAAHTA